MTGLRGLLFTSATGAKFTCTPSARASVPVIRASARTRRSPSPPGIAPMAICLGNVVAPKMRNPTPVSKSAELSSGTVEIDCSRLIRNAAENGCPRITVP